MKSLLKKILPAKLTSFIARHLQAERDHLTNLKFSAPLLEMNIIGVTSKDYENYKYIREAEHQIGRFINMQKILKEIEDTSLIGDLVEFGTWQGQGLRLFDLAITHKTNRKLVGIDSFEGLPETSTVWHKGTFSNTSKDMVAKTLDSNIKNFDSVELIQGWFDNPSVANELYEKVKDISIVHLDADLASSTTTALNILEKYMEGRTSPMFLLFDDWGCHPNEVPEAFNSWLASVKSKYNIQEEIVGYTNLTRYFKLNFKN